MSVPLKKTIGLRLLRYVFGFYFAVAIIVTSAQLVLEYFHVKSNIFMELANLGETLEASLARSIWNYNAEQVQSTLLGTSKIVMVSGTKVTDASGEVIAVNGRTAENKQHISTLMQEGDFGDGIIHEINYLENEQTKTLFEYKFPIYFKADDDAQSELIGYCHIYASHSSIVDRVQYGFVLIIINSLIKTLALWLIFLYFTKRIVAKPLGALTKATQVLNPSDPETFRHSHDIDRVFYSEHDDELHRLADSFVHMRDSIVEKIDCIEQQNLHLEQRVKERTAAIEGVNRELKHLSLHDPLTNLPNRNLFHDRLENLLNMAKRESFSFAVASVDLRKFKEVNDTFGHQAGDFVLQVLSKRMQSVIHDVDTISRMGGDEFAILFKGVDRSTINIVGEKIVSCAYEPIVFGGETILAGLNVGFSVYPDHGFNSEELYKNADVAMYQAKKNEDGIFLFSPEVKREVQRRDVIVQDIEAAVENEQLSLFYQPIVVAESHSVKGVEALLRWYHPGLRMVPPDEFIAIAERSNTIQRITEWVVRKALDDANRFQDAGYDLSISVNLSGRLVGDESFLKKLKHILSRYDHPRDKLVLELTESSTMRSPEKAIDFLSQLKATGIGLSIDDFGTGYSSFSYLARLPVDELKIDRSFLVDVNDNGQMVVESMIDLAHRLDLKVVAEGVENQEIITLLESLGSDYLQGYHFSKPIPFDQLLLWLSRYN